MRRKLLRAGRQHSPTEALEHEPQPSVSANYVVSSKCNVFTNAQQNNCATIYEEKEADTVALEHARTLTTNQDVGAGGTYIDRWECRPYVDERPSGAFQTREGRILEQAPAHLHELAPNFVGLDAQSIDDSLCHMLDWGEDAWSTVERRRSLTTLLQRYNSACSRYGRGTISAATESDGPWERRGVALALAEPCTTWLLTGRGASAIQAVGRSGFPRERPSSDLGVLKTRCFPPFNDHKKLQIRFHSARKESSIVERIAWGVWFRYMGCRGTSRRCGQKMSLVFAGAYICTSDDLGDRRHDDLSHT